MNYQPIPFISFPVRIKVSLLKFHPILNLQLFIKILFLYFRKYNNNIKFNYKYMYPSILYTYNKGLSIDKICKKETFLIFLPAIYTLSYPHLPTIIPVPLYTLNFS